MKIIVNLFILSFFFFPSAVFVKADLNESEKPYAVYDCTSDLREYAHTVADLNQQVDVQSKIPKRRIKINSITVEVQRNTLGDAVLCKTSGRNLTIWESDLNYVVEGPNGCYTMYYADQDAANAAIEYYLTLPEILYAELDCEVTSSEINVEADDSSAFHSWGAERMHFREYLDFTTRWENSKSIVAIIDSGVCGHPLIDPKIDHLGYDYVDADEDPTNDQFGHGTHVAGIVADCTNSAPVYLYPIRVLNAFGKGKMSNIVNAVMEAQAQGVSVINLSIESGTLSQALDTAIMDAVSSGITVIAAAGNSACDTVNVCPAHLNEKGVIVVGAVEENDNGFVRTSYSNFGESVDVYTYGSNIVSCSIDEGYVSDTGTSMATPHISSLAALLLLVHPEITPEELEDRIVGAAEVNGDLRIPNLSKMIPQTEDFFLQEIRMVPEESIQLPTMARPLTACEHISYQSSDTSVVETEAGMIKSITPGVARVTATCIGFTPVEFTVNVEETDNLFTIHLPDSIKELEDESFKGDTQMKAAVLPDGLEKIGNHVFQDCPELRFLNLPDSLQEIGENTFSSAVIMCSGEGYVYDYVLENQLQYILITTDP